MTVLYGKKIRNMVSKIQKKTQQKYKCPSCSRKTVRRVSSGVWQCRKCNKKFASGAYEFR